MKSTCAPLAGSKCETTTPMIIPESTDGTESQSIETQERPGAQAGEAVAGFAQDNAAAEAMLEDAAQDLLLLRKPELEGIEIFDYCLASAALLRDCRSQLLLGIMPSQMENLEMELAKFLVIHSTDLMNDDALEQLAQDVRNEEKFRVRALKIARMIEGNKGELMTFCLTMIAKADETAIRVIQKEERQKAETDLMSLHTSVLPKA